MKKSVPLFAFAAFLLPGIALSATPTTFAGLANQIVQLLGAATTDLIVLAIVIYFWGISSSLFKQGEKGHKELVKQLMWGVFVLFLAVTVWGIVQLVQSSIFGTGVGSLNSNGSAPTCSGLTNCQLGQLH